MPVPGLRELELEVARGWRPVARITIVALVLVIKIRSLRSSSISVVVVVVVVVVQLATLVRLATLNQRPVPRKPTAGRLPTFNLRFMRSKNEVLIYSTDDYDNAGVDQNLISV